MKILTLRKLFQGNFNRQIMNLKNFGVSTDLGYILLSNKFLPLLLFFLFFFVFLTTSGGHIMTLDGMLTFIMTENFVTNGSPTLNIDSLAARQTGFGVYYSIEDIVTNRAEREYEKEQNKEITKEEFTKDYFEKTNLNEVPPPHYVVVPTVAAPLYLIAKSIGAEPLNFVPWIFNSSIVAITAVVIFFLSKEIFNSERIGFVLSLLFGFTSYIWPYTNGMLARPLAILFMMLSIYFLIRNKKNEHFFFPIFAGVSLGLMGLTHANFFLLMPGLVAFGFFELRKNRKYLMLFGISLVLLFLVQAVVNDYRFGSPFDLYGLGEFSRGGNTDAASKWISEFEFDGIYGFLISPDNSLFVYFPIALLLPLGGYCLYKKDRALTLLFIFIFVVTYGYIATTDTAVGGEGGKWNSVNAIWGPHRYLLPLIPIITISIGAIISKFPKLELKIPIIILSVFGFVVNLLGSLVFWRLAFNYGFVNEGLNRVRGWNEIMTWEPQYSSVALSLKVLENNYVNFKNEFQYYVNWGLEGCSLDSYIFCQYGNFALGLMIIFISIIVYLTMVVLISPSLSKKISK